MGAKTVYKSTESEHLQLSFFQFNASCGMQLDSQNEWVKDANRLPWRVWESQYSAIFTTTTGNVAKPSRMVIGSLIIQQRMGFSCVLEHHLLFSLADSFLGFPHIFYRYLLCANSQSRTASSL